MNPHYNQNYTKEQIEVYLVKVKSCIVNDKYTISLNKDRQKNKNFINEYNIRADKIKDILLNIQIDDFCHTLKNTNVGYEHEILYVFAPIASLFNVNDKLESVDIYVKINIIESQFNNNMIVISFHKPEKPLDYLFK